MSEVYSFEDAFFISLYYNCYEDTVLKLIDYFSNVKDDETDIIRPDFINDPVIELLWMILVIKFGNYGTSPRSGWIESKNKDRVISLLQNNYLISAHLAELYFRNL